MPGWWSALYSTWVTLIGPNLCKLGLGNVLTLLVQVWKYSNAIGQFLSPGFHSNLPTAIFSKPRLPEVGSWGCGAGCSGLLQQVLYRAQAWQLGKTGRPWLALALAHVPGWRAPCFHSPCLPPRLAPAGLPFHHSNPPGSGSLRHSIATSWLGHVVWLCGHYGLAL